MFWNILKKDLKRKKTMNVILLLFIVLATLFVSSSVSNISGVLGGIDHYFHEAGIGDVNFATIGSCDRAYAEERLRNKDYIQDIRIDDAVLIATNIRINGKEEKVGSPIVNSLEDSSFTFFDDSNEVVTRVADGKTMVTIGAMDQFGWNVGDIVSFDIGDTSYEYEIAGAIKDATFGSSIMGNVRILLSSSDFEELHSNPSAMKSIIAAIDTTDVNKVKEDCASIDGAQVFLYSMIKMTYVLDMLTAVIMLVASIALIVVSFVVLKFAINLAVNEEIREIGIMKAIGLKDRRIRSLYVIKYMCLGLVGGLIGFAAGIPFSEYLLKAASRSLVLESSGGILFPLLSTLAVVIIITAYSYGCTGRIRKYSPLDAIREGQTGERFKKKKGLRISKSHLSTTGYMAVNDIKSSPKRYISVVIAFALCTSLVLTLVNTVNTLRSGNLAYAFGKASDIYFDPTFDPGMDLLSPDTSESIRLDVEDKLRQNGYEADCSVDIGYNLVVHFEGKESTIRGMQGVNISTEDLVYYEGVAPASANEIAITEIVSNNTGIHIGDYVEITFNDTTDTYLVTAYFETMNSMGECIRLHEDTDMSGTTPIMIGSFQIDFKDDPNQAEIADRVEKLKDIFNTDNVYSAAEYVDNTTNSSDTLEGISYIFLLITIAVVILMSILMERSFISDEKNEIAIMKAVGFKDSKIVLHHIKRFMYAALIAVVLAVILSIPLTELCITPIFQGMGMKSMTFEYNFLQIGLIYPLIVLGFTFVSSGLTSLYTRTITSRDTASIE